MTAAVASTDPAEAIVRRHASIWIVANPRAALPWFESSRELLAFRAMLGELGAHLDTEITANAVLRSVGIRGTSAVVELATLAGVLDAILLRSLEMGVAGSIARHARLVGFGRVAIAVGRNGGRPISEDDAQRLMRGARRNALAFGRDAG